MVRKGLSSSSRVQEAGIANHTETLTIFHFYISHTQVQFVQFTQNKNITVPCRWLVPQAQNTKFTVHHSPVQLEWYSRRASRSLQWGMNSSPHSLFSPSLQMYYIVAAMCEPVLTIPLPPSPTVELTAVISNYF